MHTETHARIVDFLEEILVTAECLLLCGGLLKYRLLDSFSKLVKWVFCL